MNNTGFFFCGLLVGVVVSAAFGLDFFPAVDPHENPGRGALGSARPGALDAPPFRAAGQPDLVAELDAAGRKVATLEADLAATRQSLEAREAEVATLESRMRQTTPDPDAELAKLKQAQRDLEQERRRVRRLEADLELSHGETYNLLKGFFASPRSSEDAILISGYFATSAPEKLKGDLVDQLLRTNREVIASLSPVSSQHPDDGERRGAAGLAPASARTGVSAPEASVLRNGERRNFDPQATDAFDPSTGPSLFDENKAVRLPRPPGE